MLSVAPRVCVALDKCVKDGQGELGAFPQVDSSSSEFREDSEFRVRGVGVSILKGFCHVDSSQNVRHVGCVGVWSLFVRERRSSVWRRLLLQSSTELLCSVLRGSSIGDAGSRSGNRRTASAGRTEGCGRRTAALSERVSSSGQYSDAKQRFTQLVGPVRCEPQVAR